MDESYDIIILGTGLKECILSGLMSSKGEKVLHIDRNNYYGGECASLNLEQMYEKFKPEMKDQKIPEKFGRARDYCIDLCPKLLMASGNLVRILIKTKCKKYLQFRSVMGSFVYKDGKIHKVPSTPSEATSSSLLGFFEKFRFRSFLSFCAAYNKSDPKTHKGYDLDKIKAIELFKEYSLDEGTIEFTGHAAALYENNDYLQQPARELVDRIKLYASSVSLYGHSPYIYPQYGLGGLPEGFSRLSAVHGGTYMLNTPIKRIVYGEDGKVVGVEDETGQIAKCNKLICDPSYVLDTNKIKKTTRIIRCICILNAPIPNTNNADSCQIIIPFTQMKRKNDIYICLASFEHYVAAKGKYIAVVSTKMESNTNDDKIAFREIEPALALLGNIEEKFFFVSDFYEPTDDGTKDNVFVTSSLDSQTHFESATDEVLQLYSTITGQELDLINLPEDDDE